MLRSILQNRLLFIATFCFDADSYLSAKLYTHASTYARIGYTRVGAIIAHAVTQILVS
jgi:hypothetical protein